MNCYSCQQGPQQYSIIYPAQQEYYPSQYEPQFWQAVVAVIIDLIILAVLAAWGLSIVRKAFKGEEVELPIMPGRS